MRYVEEHIDGLKAQVLLFSIGCITKEILERKHEILKKRLVVATALGAGVAALSVPGLDVAINAALLVQEVCHYMSVFGINRKRVDSLRDFDHSLLRCRSLLKQNVDMTCFVVAQIGTYATLLLVQSVVDLILPLIGSIISSATAARVTYQFLGDMLQVIEHDAMLIYEHIMNNNV